MKGVDLSSKTTKCIYCGKTLKMKKLKIFYQTESREKLGKAIGSINSKLNKFDIQENFQMIKNKS